MKSIVFTFFLIISNPLISQNKSIDSWIQNVVSDMIEMNDLEKYSSETLASNLKVNFLMVESVKDISVNDDIITMLLNHGKGTYCTQLKFQFIKRTETYYLVFSDSETKKILGKESQWVNPWIEKKNICD